MQNLDVVHKWFYDLDGDFNRYSMNVSYYKSKFYSYVTVIAKVVKDTQGNNVCIVSDNTFRNTTARHINAILSACPYNIIRLPQYMGNSDFMPADVVKHIKENLEYYSKAKLTQKHNREGLSNYYEMLENTLILEDFKNYFKEIKALLKEYRTLYESVNDPNKRKELKAIQAQKDKKEQLKLKKQCNGLLKKYDYLTLVKFAFSDFWLNDFSIDAYNKQKEQKIALQKYFNSNKDYAFIWVDDDKIKTSKHITVDKKEAFTLLHLWEHNKLKKGMKVSYYPVLEYNDKFVKIGCHKIPTQNLKELLKVA